MAAENENHQNFVKIVDVYRVAPQSSSSPKSLPLTFFDIGFLQFPPTHRLFFYETETTSSSFDTIIVPKLKHSLSLILQHYLPLSGNLTWPQHSHTPILQFLHGDSVSFTVAESHDSDFHHLTCDGFREATVYNSLVPQLSYDDERVASIAFQITRFQNSGFSIGIAHYHAILDGTSLFSFVKSWAQICNTLIHINGANSSSSSSIDPMMTVPFYDRTTIKEPEDLEAFDLNKEGQYGPDKRITFNKRSSKTQEHDLIRCTLELNGQNLKKLKQWVLKKQEEEKKQKSVNLSTFTVASAYLWVCQAKCDNLRDIKRVWIFPVNARSRLEPPLPSNYFGNCIILRGCSVDGNELLDNENGMMVAAEAISEEIKALEQGVFKGAMNYLLPSIGSGKIGEGGRIFIGGSPRFEVYNTDFGWGKPKKVEGSVYIGIINFYLTDSRNGDGGIHIGLIRKRNEMESFTSLFAQGLEAMIS